VQDQKPTTVSRENAKRRKGGTRFGEKSKNRVKKSLGSIFLNRAPDRKGPEGTQSELLTSRPAPGGGKDRFGEGVGKRARGASLLSREEKEREGERRIGLSRKGQRGHGKFTECGQGPPMSMRPLSKKWSGGGKGQRRRNFLRGISTRGNGS